MHPSHTSLTSHLYRLEEVIYALRWSILCHAYTEAIFWALELFDSDYLTEAFECLTKTYVLYIGLKTHPGLYEKLLRMKAAEELDRDEFILLVYNLARIKRRDATPMHLILMGLVDVAWKPSFVHRAYETLDDGIEDCLNRGKIKEAWLLSQQRSLNESLEDAAVRISQFSKVPCEPETRVYDTLLKELTLIITYWDSEQSMRKRRVYSPKPEAIVWMCERTFRNTEADIMGGLEQSLFDSPYWKSILQQYGSVDGKEMQWSTERLKEQFYETYFTDDIPDEWSAADREKSHGRALQISEPVAKIKYYNNILLKTSSLLWGPMKPVTCFPNGRKMIEFPLKAVKKVFTLVDAQQNKGQA
jgi:hypothetical protein